MEHQSYELIKRNKERINHSGNPQQNSAVKRNGPPNGSLPPMQNAHGLTPQGHAPGIYNQPLMIEQFVNNATGASHQKGSNIADQRISNDMLLNNPKKGQQVLNKGSMDKQSLSNQALIIKKKSDTATAGELPQHHNVSSMTDNMAKEKKGAIRPLSINQVQRIVGKDTENSLIDTFNHG